MQSTLPLSYLSGLRIHFSLSYDFHFIILMVTPFLLGRTLGKASCTPIGEPSSCCMPLSHTTLQLAPEVPLTGRWVLCLGAPSPVPVCPPYHEGLHAISFQIEKNPRSPADSAELKGSLLLEMPVIPGQKTIGSNVCAWHQRAA